jgi:UDP-N-acetylglucosamine--N-acetylmuramyl-(pentapeptide) pyrophosphoryl-undecaprenol N-acetylglucosamine transferase
MRLLLAGGGTGGHVFPAIAVAQELRRHDPDAAILFVGTPRGLEARAVPRAGFALALLPVFALRGVTLLRAMQSAALLKAADWMRA